MNILHVINSMDPSNGGTCQAVRNIVPSLKKLSVESEVVCLDDAKASFLVNESLQIHPLGPSKGPWNYGARLIPWLTENLSRFNVVIVHGLWLYHGYATIKVILNFRKNNINGNPPKIFIMPHGMLDPYFQRAPERKLKAIRNWIYWKVIESNIINNSDGLLFTCKAELLLAREPFRPYHPKKELNVGLGIEPPPPYNGSMFKAFFEKCPQLKSQKYLLFISRIHEKKGVDVLIRAYSKIVGKGTPKLVVAGPGLETTYGQSIQQLVSDAELTESVFFPGMLSGDVKWACFYNCEAFVLPSHQENFGIAVVEGLACYKPVLISNKVNIWNEIEATGGGIVAEDTIEGTTSMLQRWMSLSIEAKQSMGQGARDAFEKYFAIDPVAQRIIEAVSE